MGEGRSAVVGQAFARRRDPVAGLTARAGEIALICRELAVRFRAGGRLFAVGSGAALTDAEHIAVEFIHPVIMGKPALPAIALDSAASWLGTEGSGSPGLWRSDDVAVGVTRSGPDDPTWSALRRARADGLFTVALSGADGPGLANRFGVHRCVAVDCSEPAVLKEAQVTIYHLLWEMVHVFNDAPGSGAGRSDGASLAGLYPFLYGDAHDPAQLLAAVSESAATKIGEIVALREQLGATIGPSIDACADRLAIALREGATMWTFGNGGSSTDAQAVADRFMTGNTSHTTNHISVRAHCLTAEPAVLTALTNDVGFDVVFARQLRALARTGDIAVGLSTSGGSANVLAAFKEAEQIGMTTVGFAGYDGGAMAGLTSLDFLLAVGSSSVHRIQELQTTLYDVLHEATLAALTG